MNYQLVNKPERIELIKYEQALCAYVDKVLQTNDILSIWTMGSVGSPGLSDLDVIVVLNDDFDRHKSRRLSVAGINDKLFIHGPIIIPESMSCEFQWLIYATNLQKIYGEGDLQDFNKVKKSHVEPLVAAYLVDFCESRMLQYATVEATGCADIRSWLTRTWSVLHSVNIIRDYFKVEILPAHIGELVEKVKIPRQCWNSGEEPSSVQIIDAIEASKKINDWCFLFGLEYFYGGSKLRHAETISFPDKTIKFKEGLLGYKSRQFRFFSRTLNKYICSQDSRYAKHLSIYMGNEPHCTALKFDVLKKRSERVRKHWAWLNAHAPFANSMSGYIGLPKPRGFYESRMRALIRNLFLRAL